ncbi:hypothetical protein B0H16DRAFT_1743407 [Mycena metata]|uniref:Uncharacterized protein n=1 Tax=Mycena metata TaxID=1033252 RepID=A0AAD7H6R6_9AGAR|nr:hypothetical protein B0H16DRAFT_1743407 [Mycena metata]
MAKTHCQPRYFPQPGDEDTIVHDGRKDGRYFVVGAGHCGSGVFTNAHVADLQTNGFSGYAKRSAKRWVGLNGVEEIWKTFCEDYHKDGCHRASLRLPDGWLAPTPVPRGCNAPPAPGAAAPGVAGTPTAAGAPAATRAPAAARAPGAPAPIPAPASAPQTPRAGNGSGSSWASPLVVRSSVSPSPLRPAPPLYSVGRPASSASGSGGARTALDPNGGMASTSARSSMLSAMGASSTSTSSLSSSQASSASRTPKKPTSQTRIQSSPNGGYDTDYFYDEDSDEETRFWAVRGLATMYLTPDEALDALRQNMDRLTHMEIRTSTNVSKLRRFVES